jgi:hypothetical protein
MPSGSRSGSNISRSHSPGVPVGATELTARRPTLTLRRSAGQATVALSSGAPSPRELEMEGYGINAPSPMAAIDYVLVHQGDYNEQGAGDANLL